LNDAVDPKAVGLVFACSDAILYVVIGVLGDFDFVDAIYAEMIGVLGGPH
jgi:hypothetical protein